MSEETKWLWPVPGTKTNDYSRNFGNGHTGIDILTPSIIGMNVVASKGGKVSKIFDGCENFNGFSDNGKECDTTGCLHPTEIKYYDDNGILIGTRKYCNDGVGNAVIIKHSNNSFSQYCHLQTIKVEEGQDVSQGDVIGTVGSTGESSGPHLHFSLSTSDNPFGTTRYNNNPDVIDYVYEIEQPTQTIK